MLRVLNTRIVRAELLKTYLANLLKMARALFIKIK